MKILITGARGFVGRNLTESLKAIAAGKDRTRPGLYMEALFLYDLGTAQETLDRGCHEADFVFHLAGVNRPKENDEFFAGNRDFTQTLLGKLEQAGNRCPVMLSSSIQATLIGRYGQSDYGKSKLAGEGVLFDYGRRTGAEVLCYRFPNLFGKWSRPNYNSAVATFCHNIGRDLPITVSDPNAELELAYIDDVVTELLDALSGKPHRCAFDGLTPVPDENGAYCYVPVTHRVTLGRIVSLLQSFHDQPSTLMMPAIAPGSFEKKLYSTYLSFLPPERAAFALKSNTDARGSFTELLKTADHGQFSVNISKPGITKGEHWHHSKWEFFMVVSGTGLIRLRQLGSSQVYDFPVSGEKLQAVQMLPGYTHSIVNLSDTQDLVTLMWANECFDPARPDTFYEKVVQDHGAVSK